MGWQWHQLDRNMQIICTSFKTDNHASSSPLIFYRPDAPSGAANNVKALKESISHCITLFIQLIDLILCSHHGFQLYCYYKLLITALRCIQFVVFYQFYLCPVFEHCTCGFHDLLYSVIVLFSNAVNVYFYTVLSMYIWLRCFKLPLMCRIYHVWYLLL